MDDAPAVDIKDYTPTQIATLLTNFRANQFRHTDHTYKERTGPVVRGLETQRGLDHYQQRVLGMILEMVQNSEGEKLDRLKSICLRAANREDCNSDKPDDRSGTEALQNELDGLIGKPQRSWSRWLP